MLLTLSPLRDAVAGAKTVEQLKQALAASPLVESVEERVASHPHYGKRTWAVIDVKLREPLPARELAAAMKWKRPYVVSSDVHQENWRLVVWESDLKDPYGKRIAAVEPTVGKWVFVRVDVDDRPAGDPPGISWGASPAYPLDRYTANVTRFEIELLDPERHTVSTR